MCLGIPGKITRTYRKSEIRMGEVSFEGVTKEVCLEHVLEAGPGDYVLVHVGFALSTIDEEEARQIFEMLESMSQLDELQAQQSESGKT